MDPETSGGGFASLFDWSVSGAAGQFEHDRQCGGGFSSYFVDGGSDDLLCAIGASVQR
ncbi:hypothetical protein OHR68_24935 [Spirillospora sp. NBC_00431]